MTAEQRGLRRLPQPRRLRHQGALFPLLESRLLRWGLKVEAGGPLLQVREPGASLGLWGRQARAGSRLVRGLATKSRGQNGVRGLAWGRVGKGEGVSVGGWGTGVKAGGRGGF